MTPENGPHRVAIHRSLLTRLLVVSLLIAVGSIASTAWLAVTSTTRALQQEQGQALAGEAHVYDALMAYAATHHSWDGVQSKLDALADQQHRGIRLTTPDNVPIVASRASGGSVPAQPTAVIDPLNVVPSLVPAAGASQIDPRAVGPYRLTKNERQRLYGTAQKVASCLQGLGIKMGEDLNVTIDVDPSGRRT